MECFYGEVIVMLDNRKRTIRSYYLFSSFSELLIVGPIIVLYMLGKGLSFTEIMLLQSVCAFSVFLFEVPTGALADRVSRKTSLIFGAFFYALGLFIYIIGSNFYVFAFGEIMFSLGTAMKSGADTALLYDNMKVEDNLDHFQDTLGKGRMYMFILQGVGSVLGAFSYTIHPDLPLWISIGFMAVTIFIVLNINEEKVNHEEGDVSTSYFAQIKDSALYVIGHKRIKAIIVFAMAFFIFFRAGFWYYQPYMEAVNLPVSTFGIFFFLFNMVAAYTSKNSTVIIKRTKSYTMMVVALCVLVSFFILGSVASWVGVFAILLQQVSRGLYMPVINKYVNKHIPSSKRATILSFISLATGLAAGLTLPLVGWVKDHYSVFQSHLILAVVMSVVFLAVNFYLKRQLSA